MNCFYRKIQLVFTSDTLKKQLTIGSSNDEFEDEVDIEIEGTKYLSSLKDVFTINIYNLTYNEMSQLINGRYYDIEIRAGYRNSNIMTIFKGSVIYISNDKYELNTNRCIILCGSNFIAKFGQQRMNLSLNNGLNLYDATNFILKRAGLKNIKIDESLKSRVIKETESLKESPQSWIETFCDSNGLISNVDSTSGTDISIISAYKTNNRLISLTSDNIILTGGFPKINSDGLELTCLATFNFIPGDVIQIDNSLINTSVDSYNKASDLMNSIYIDVDGKYLVYEITYKLSNTTGDFTCLLKARAKSLYNSISQYQGATQ